MTREELIEEAAKAIQSAHHPTTGAIPGWDSEEDAWRETYRAFSRAAFAVFEKAQAPTNDERESYLQPDLYNKLMAHLLTESGRDGLLLANEVRNATGASKLHRPAQTELEGWA